ncbi:hypothetical protein B0H19DRAFT_1181030, partial [Mycena capillaripes]
MIFFFGHVSSSDNLIRPFSPFLLIPPLLFFHLLHLPTPPTHLLTIPPHSQEFGIDIVGEHGEVVHRKVAARVTCAFTPADAARAVRAETRVYPPPSASSPNAPNAPPPVPPLPP